RAIGARDCPCRSSTLAASQRSTRSLHLAPPPAASRVQVVVGRHRHSGARLVGGLAFSACVQEDCSSRQHMTIPTRLLCTLARVYCTVMPPRRRGAPPPPTPCATRRSRPSTPCTPPPPRRRAARWCRSARGAWAPPTPTLRRRCTT